MVIFTTYAFLSEGIERRSGNEGMGRFAEVYDAKMLALLRGLEAAVELQ